MFSLFILGCTLSGTKVQEDSAVVGEPSADTGSQSNEASSEPSAEVSTEPSNEPSAEEECINEVLYTTPEDQALEVLYRTAIEVEMLNSAEDVQLQLFLEDTEINGQSTVEDTVIRFVPDSELQPNTSYNMVVGYCEESITYSFSTSDLGDATARDLSGDTFVFDLYNARWPKPAGLGSVLAAQFSSNMLLGIHSFDESSFSPVITVSDEFTDYQDMCFPTAGGIVTADFTQNPYFSIGPVNVDFVLSGFPITIDNFFLSAVLESNGSFYHHGTISGVVDARIVETVVAFTAEQLCDLLDGLGSSCLPCADGAAFCFEIEAVDISGYATGNTMECVGYAYCHPDCTNNGCPSPNQGLCDF